MNNKIYLHIIQLSMSFPIGRERLFDLLRDGRAKVDFEFNDIGCVLTLFIDEKHESVFESLEADSVLSEESSNTVCASRAFCKAAEKLLNYRPSWGAISGVKPVRLYLNLLERGLEADKILLQNYLVSQEKTKITKAVGDLEYKILQNIDNQSYNLYISIPFCPSRCRYCSFISLSATGTKLIPEYMKVLCDEIKSTALIMRDKKLNTIYIGGGTPTVLNENELKILLSVIKSSFIYNNIEYTLEGGRPDTINAEKLNIAREYGVNRVSINTQTTNDAILSDIGRLHTADDYLKAFALARTAKIPIINTDLIAGFENDTFEKSLDEVIALAPENITVHTLCVKNSAYFREDGFVRQDGNIEKLLDYSDMTCHNNAYFPYYLYKQKNALSNSENVGYAKKGCECLYNICMMSELNSTIALGAGGATKIVDKNKTIDKTTAFFNCKYPDEYIKNGAKLVKKLEFLKYNL